MIADWLNCWMRNDTVVASILFSCWPIGMYECIGVGWARNAPSTWWHSQVDKRLCFYLETVFDTLHWEEWRYSENWRILYGFQWDNQYEWTKSSIGGANGDPNLKKVGKQWRQWEQWTYSKIFTGTIWIFFYILFVLHQSILSFWQILIVYISLIISIKIVFWYSS